MSEENREKKDSSGGDRDRKGKKREENSRQPWDSMDERNYKYLAKVIEHLRHHRPASAPSSRSSSSSSSEGSSSGQTTTHDRMRNAFLVVNPRDAMLIGSDEDLYNGFARWIEGLTLTGFQFLSTAFGAAGPNVDVSPVDLQSTSRPIIPDVAQQISAMMVSVAVWIVDRAVSTETSHGAEASSYFDALASSNPLVDPFVSWAAGNGLPNLTVLANQYRDYIERLLTTMPTGSDSGQDNTLQMRTDLDPRVRVMVRLRQLYPDQLHGAALEFVLVMLSKFPAEIVNQYLVDNASQWDIALRRIWARPPMFIAADASLSAIYMLRGDMLQDMRPLQANLNITTCTDFVQFVADLFGQFVNLVVTESARTSDLVRNNFTTLGYVLQDISRDRLLQRAQRLRLTPISPYLESNVGSWRFLEYLRRFGRGIASSIRIQFTPPNTNMSSSELSLNEYFTLVGGEQWMRSFRPESSSVPLDTSTQTSTPSTGLNIVATNSSLLSTTPTASSSTRPQGLSRVVDHSAGVDDSMDCRPDAPPPEASSQAGRSHVETLPMEGVESNRRADTSLPSEVPSVDETTRELVKEQDLVMSPDQPSPSDSFSQTEDSEVEHLTDLYWGNVGNAHQEEYGSDDDLYWDEAPSGYTAGTHQADEGSGSAVRQLDSQSEDADSSDSEEDGRHSDSGEDDGESDSTEVLEHGAHSLMNVTDSEAVFSNSDKDATGSNADQPEDSQVSYTVIPPQPQQPFASSSSLRPSGGSRHPSNSPREAIHPYSVRRDANWRLPRNPSSATLNEDGGDVDPWANRNVFRLEGAEPRGRPPAEMTSSRATGSNSGRATPTSGQQPADNAGPQVVRRSQRQIQQRSQSGGSATDSLGGQTSGGNATAESGRRLRSSRTCHAHRE